MVAVGKIRGQASELYTGPPSSFFFYTWRRGLFVGRQEPKEEEEEEEGLGGGEGVGADEIAAEGVEEGTEVGGE